MQPLAMQVSPLCDSAWLATWPGPADEATLSQVLAAMRGLEHGRPANVVDVVSSFTSLAVHYEGDGTEVREWLLERLTQPQEKNLEGALHVIPVRYQGEDLGEIAAATGFTTETIIALHANADYRVAAIGFSPGFPYLLGLPKELDVPRRKTPRLKVPAGSVAIANGQAGIYPTASPGGWQVLGKTRATLFDPNATPPALLKPGDRVRFQAMDKWLDPLADDVISTPTSGPVRVIDPGALTTIQDLGRFGHGNSGVTPGGAADRDAARVANWLVGNDENAAVLECCVRGPILEFQEATTIAVVSSHGRSFQLGAGETVDLTKIAGGVRACIAVAGGWAASKLLDSAATDVRAGFGGLQGRALQFDDRLDIGTPSRIPRCGAWHVGFEGEPPKAMELRFVRGVQHHWFDDATHRRFRESLYQITPNSDRMGARLSGETLSLVEPRELISQPVVCGSVQVPPDGQPIVLMAERQTIGGYPQIGHVISADLPKLARAWPGTAVHFREITLEEAWEATRRKERDFQWLRTGLELMK